MPAGRCGAPCQAGAVASVAAASVATPNLASRSAGTAGRPGRRRRWAGVSILRLTACQLRSRRSPGTARAAARWHGVHRSRCDSIDAASPKVAVLP